MRWLNDKPPSNDIWFMVMWYVLGTTILAGCIWYAVDPAKDISVVVTTEAI